jgi:hypothetical protein
MAQSRARAGQPLDRFVKLRREARIEVGQPRFGAPRPGRVPQNRVGQREAIPCGGNVGPALDGLGVRGNRGLGATELLHRVAANAQRLGVARLGRGPALGQLDQLAPPTSE